MRKVTCARGSGESDPQDPEIPLITIANDKLLELGIQELLKDQQLSGSDPDHQDDLPAETCQKGSGT